MTVDAWVSLLALGVAFYAGFRILPRPLVLPWNALFQTTLAASAAGTVPEGADAAIDPRTSLGFGWSELVAWSPTVPQALARRLESIVWVSAGTDVDVPAPLGVGGLKLGPLDPAASEALLARLSAELAQPHQRLVFVVGRSDALAVLQLLRAQEVLRDNTRAVVFVDPDLAEPEMERWLAENFQHDALDTELNIPISYVLVRGAPGPDLPERPVPRSGSRALDVVNLAPVALDARPHVERALLVLLAHKARAW